MFTSDNTIDAEISHRIGCALGSFNGLRKSLWSDRNIDTDTKMSTFNAVVMSTLLYGCETWSVLSQHLSDLEKFQMQCLRAICGIRLRGTHTISNNDIREMCKQPLVADTIKHHRLRWLGHVGRMSNNRIPKICVLFGKLETRCQTPATY